LDAPGGRPPTLVVASQRLLDRRGADQRVSQYDRVHERAVGTLPKVRGHGVCRVTEQDQPAREPATAVDSADGVDQQVVEGCNAAELHSKWKDRGPRPNKGRKMSAGDGVPHSCSVGSRPDVRRVVAQWGVTEGTQRRPVLRQRTVQAARNQRADVRTALGDPADEAARTTHRRSGAVGADHQVGAQDHRRHPLARTVQRHRPVRIRADDLAPEARFDPIGTRRRIEQQAMQHRAPDSEGMIEPSAEIRHRR
jgi:hypothetical protein